MSEKVVLTQEQAEELELQKKELPTVGIVQRRMLSNRINDAFESIDLYTLIKALYIGYEVEQEVKDGDFVDIGLFGISKVAEVTGVKGKLIAINGSDEYHEFKINGVLTDEEKQEEKQCRWWAKHGRKVWEIREDDILEYLGDLYIIDSFDSEEVCLKSGIERKTNYGEPFDYVKRHFKVVCFAEDRKDV